LNPDFLGHPDNYIKANPFFTPLHITPEWYFLPLYAVLRSIPNKLLGIFVLFMFISCIFLLPYICKGFIIKNTSYRPYYASLAIFLIVIFILLGWIGSCPVSTPFLQLGQLFTFLYFFIILVLFPLCGYFEKIIYIWYITKKKKKILILW
jgi:ubiquinol-cytochrome c reductase cytochrome b subunit